MNASSGRSGGCSYPEKIEGKGETHPKKIEGKREIQLMGNIYQQIYINVSLSSSPATYNVTVNS